MKVWDRAGIKLATPGSAVSFASVTRHVTDCATRPSNLHQYYIKLFSMTRSNFEILILPFFCLGFGGAGEAAGVLLLLCVSMGLGLGSSISEIGSTLGVTAVVLSIISSFTLTDVLSTSCLISVFISVLISGLMSRAPDELVATVVMDIDVILLLVVTDVET